MWVWMQTVPRERNRKEVEEVTRGEEKIEVKDKREKNGVSMVAAPVEVERVLTMISARLDATIRAARSKGERTSVEAEWIRQKRKEAKRRRKHKKNRIKRGLIYVQKKRRKSKRRKRRMRNRKRRM